MLKNNFLAEYFSFKIKFSCIWRKTWISNHITFGFIFLFRLFPKSTSSIWEDNRHSNGSYFLHGHYYQSIWNYYRTVYSLYSFQKVISVQIIPFKDTIVISQLYQTNIWIGRWSNYCQDDYDTLNGGQWNWKI